MTIAKQSFILICALVIGGFIYVLSPILSPFIIGLLLAYLANPLVDRLVRYRIQRTVAVLIVFLLFFLVLLLLALLLIPMLFKQLHLLIQMIPTLIQWIQETVLPWLSHYVDIDNYLNLETIKQTVQKNWAQAGSWLTDVAKTVTSSSIAFVFWLSNLILIPVVTFYLLRDWHKLLAGISRLLPRSNAPTLIHLAKGSDEVLGAFFFGQVIVMLSLAIIYTLGLSFIGLNVALLIGFLAGLFSLVPYLGFIIGIISAIVAALWQFQDGLHVLYVVLVFGIGQLIESTFLTPVFVGNKIGLHPVAVIFSLLAGAQLFGFLGVLLALPVAAVLMVWLRHAKQQYMSSELYT